MPYVLLLCVFVFALLTSTRPTQEEIALDQRRNGLDAEILEVSLLVSQKCPANSEAHRLLIEAIEELSDCDHDKFQWANRKSYYDQCSKTLQRARQLAEV